MTDNLVRRKYTIPFLSNHPAFIDYLFDHRHFGFNDCYEDTARALVEENCFSVGDIVYKWDLRDAEIGFGVVGHSAIIYGTINGEDKPVAQLDGLSDDDIAFLTHSNKKIILIGGTGREIIQNEETGRYRLGPEKYYPWKFIVRGTARRVCRPQS